MRHFYLISCCLTSTEARWPIRDGRGISARWPFVLLERAKEGRLSAGQCERGDCLPLVCLLLWSPLKVKNFVSQVVCVCWGWGGVGGWFLVPFPLMFTWVLH